MPYAAILFDMDGTLIDSGVLWRKATAYAFDQCALPINDADLDLLAGMAISHYMQERGWGDRVEELKDVRDTLLIPLIEDGVRWCDGAEALLSSLTCPTAIVTGSHGKAFEAIKRALNIADMVDVTVTADDVHPDFKPHPKGLLLACETLNVDPAQCVYIGDQESDLLAAKAAGMDAILMRGIQTPKDLVHEKTVEDFEELTQLLTAD